MRNESKRVTIIQEPTFENAEEIHNVHPVAKQLIPEIGVRTVTPLHPGAEKYFKEKGLL